MAAGTPLDCELASGNRFGPWIELDRTNRGAMEAAVRPADLREQSRQYRLAAAEETTLAIKRRLASHATALAELAEKIERGSSDCDQPGAAATPDELALR